VATATLHAVGIALALGLARAHLRRLVRVGGAACALIGIGLAGGVIG